MSTGFGVVTAVSRNAIHHVSKCPESVVRLVADLGVAGDAHLGATVQHRSRVARDPFQRNLRQVHLIHAELHDELTEGGFHVAPGEMGENVTTRGVDLLALPARTRLSIGVEAVVELTGLRNPCAQLEEIATGLMQATLDRDDDGHLVRKAGVMAVVVTGGNVRPGDHVSIEPPVGPHQALESV